MRAIARAGVVVGVLAVLFAAAEAAEPPTKRDTRGPVTVIVTLLAVETDSGSVKAKVILDTHIENLDGIAFEEAVALRTADGADVRPTSVELTGSGHHREAAVVFVAPPGPVLIVVKDVGGVVERTFSWERPPTR